VLLPEKLTTPYLIQQVFEDINNTCKSMEIAVIGGHTEVTSQLTRPIIVGSLIGEVEKNKLVLNSGAEPGDVIILTKGIFIEGTSIIGREKEEFLKDKGMDPNFIKKCQDYLFNPGISVYKEAILAHKNFTVKACHDPTEGGIYTAIAEMTIASETGVLIEEKKINILPEPSTFCEIFKLNPYNTISSGSLLIAVDQVDAPALVDLLRTHNINAEKIGKFVSKDKGLYVKKKNGSISSLKYSETDEITKIF
jgi:hydrogenase maturation factor